jgi:hypothetical protein
MSSKILFILGAGASADLGFPTGDFKARILEAADWLKANPVRRASSNDAISFRNLFKKAAIGSIDAFLQLRERENLKPNLYGVARTAIARTLLPIEKTSAEGRNDWYGAFAESLLRNPPQERIGILTFNYDRSLEFFLHRAFEATLCWAIIYLTPHVFPANFHA